MAEPFNRLRDYDPIFGGHLSGAGTGITGEFSQSGRTFPFGLERRSAELSTIAYGPTPEKGFAGRSLEGNWQATIIADGSTMRLVLKVSKGLGEGFTARLDSPDQSILDLPVDVITLRGSALQFDMKRIGASYSGVLDADASEIAGEWLQSGASLGVRFIRLSGQTVR